MPPNRYTQILERIFLAHYKPGGREVSFEREEMATVAGELGINLPKNLGDVIYTFRYRSTPPEAISRVAPKGEHWIIRPMGRGKYQFALTRELPISPNPMLSKIKVPDATPGIIEKYALSDEQSLLAKLRYNRLIDIFTGITCYSLQNHLRTIVPAMGQVETDEIYIGLDRQGVHYVLPVQAKGGRDKMSVVQIEQDLALCASKFKGLVCRSIGAQFMPDNMIALFEFELGDQGVSLRNERHYQLVPPDAITADDLKRYGMLQLG